MTRHTCILLFLLLGLLGVTTLSLSLAGTPATPSDKPVRILNAHLGELPGLINADMAYGVEPTQRDLLIEATPGFLPIPLQRSMSIEQSLRKLSRGRIDAFIWAQEEADLVLRQLGLTNIHREHFGDFEDVFIIAKGAAGDDMDHFLNTAIDRLAASGKLAEIYSRLHRPYEVWQPHPEPLAPPAQSSTP